MQVHRALVVRGQQSQPLCGRAAAAAEAEVYDGIFGRLYVRVEAVWAQIALACQLRRRQLPHIHRAHVRPCAEIHVPRGERERERGRGERVQAQYVRGGGLQGGHGLH